MNLELLIIDDDPIGSGYVIDELHKLGVKNVGLILLPKNVGIDEMRRAVRCIFNCLRPSAIGMDYWFGDGNDKIPTGIAGMKELQKEVNDCNLFWITGEMNTSDFGGVFPAVIKGPDYSDTASTIKRHLADVGGKLNR